MAPNEQGKAAGFEQVREGLSLLEDAFDKCSKGKPFFSGDKVGYLDIAFGSYLGWVRVSEKMNNIELISKEKTPNLHAWAERFCADDAVKNYMPETEKLMGFAKMLMAKHQAAASS
ncbi:Glutathione S-transferase U18 [Bienertia sinuspersici]